MTGQADGDDMSTRYSHDSEAQTNISSTKSCDNDDKMIVINASMDSQTTDSLHSSLSTESQNGVPIKASFTWFQICQVILSVVFCCLTTGVISGYVALESVLIEQGVYSQLCTPPATQCVAQSLRLQLMYTIAASALNISCLISGIFLDQFGMRWTNATGAFIMAIGCLLFSLGSPTFDSYIPAYALIGFGGMSILMSNLRMAEYIPRHRGWFLSAISNSFDVSAFMFFIFKLIYDATHVHRRVLFLAYMAIPLILVLMSFIYLPREPHERNPFSELYHVLTCRTKKQHELKHSLSHEKQTPVFKTDAMNSPFSSKSIEATNIDANEQQFNTFGHGDSPLPSNSENIHDSIHQNTLHSASFNTEQKIQKESIDKTDMSIHSLASRSTSSSSMHSPSIPQIPVIQDPQPSLKSQLKDKRFLLMVVSMSLSVLRQEFFIGTFPSRIRYLSNNNAAVQSTSTLVFSLVFPLGALVYTPLVGITLDKSPLAYAFMGANLVGLLFDVLSAIASLVPQYIAASLIVLWRASIYSFLSLYFMKTFGYRYFGTLYGLTFFTAGVVNLVQYGLSAIVEYGWHGNWFLMDWTLLGVIGSWMIFHTALVIYWHKKKLGRSVSSSLVVREIDEQKETEFLPALVL